MKKLLKIFLSFIAILGLHQTAYSAAAKPRPVEGRAILSAKPTEDSSITQLIKQLFIDKRANGQPFTDQAFETALLELNADQANNLYQAFKGLFENIEKYIRPRMKLAAPQQGLQRDIALEKAKLYIKHLFEIKKTSSRTGETPIDNNSLSHGIANLDPSIKQSLQSLLSIILKRIPITNISQKPLNETAVKPQNETLAIKNLARPAAPVASAVPPVVRADAPAFASKNKPEKENRAQQPLLSAAGIPLAIASCQIAQKRDASGSPQATALQKAQAKQEAGKQLTLEEMRILRENQTEKIKHAQLTEKEIKKILTPTDPVFMGIYKILENYQTHSYEEFKGEFKKIMRNPNTINMQDSNGYSPLLHAIYRENYDAVLLILKWYYDIQKIGLLQSSSPLSNPQKLSDLFPIINTSIKGLNPYEFASFLEQHAPRQKTSTLNITDIKTLLRSIFSADLPRYAFFSPIASASSGRLQERAEEWIKSVDVKNQIVLWFGDLFYWRISNMYVLTPWAPVLFLQLIEKNANIRYQLFEIINIFIRSQDTNVGIYSIAKKAVEQGEPIENIEEIYETVKKLLFILGTGGGSGMETLKYAINWLKEERYEKEKHEKEIKAVHELLSKPPVQMPEDIFKNILTPSDPRLLALKHAIEDFSDAYKEENQEKLKDDQYNLLNVLGRFNVNIKLKDKTEYTPLLYAVYLNKPEAVKILLQQHKSLERSDPEFLLKRNQKYNIEKTIKQLNKDKEDLQIQRTNREKAAKDQAGQDIANQLDEIVEQVVEAAMLTEQINNLNKKIADLHAEQEKLGTYYNQIFEKTKDGMNAYCLAKFLGHKEIIEILAPYFDDKTCPK